MLGFDLVNSVVMENKSSVAYPLGGPIIMFLGLSLGNYIGIREGYLVKVPLDSLDGLMVVTWEGSLVGL